MRRIVLVHVRHVVYWDASGLTATTCTGHGRFGARRTRNKAADAAESVDAHLRYHGERAGRGSARRHDRHWEGSAINQLPRPRRGQMPDPDSVARRHRLPYSIFSFQKTKLTQQVRLAQDYTPHDLRAHAQQRTEVDYTGAHTLSRDGTMSRWLSWSWLCLTTCAMNGWSVPEGAP